MIYQAHCCPGLYHALEVWVAAQDERQLQELLDAKQETSWQIACQDLSRIIIKLWLAKSGSARTCALSTGLMRPRPESKRNRMPI